MDKLIRSGGIAELLPESRHIEGYAIVFGTQSNDIGFIETISRGAITQDLVNQCDVFCRFDHNPDKILARSNKGVGSLKLTVDEKGLKYEFDSPNTTLGDELIEYIKRGDLNKSSFCFTIADEENAQTWEKRDGKFYRTINKIGYLWDVSPVWTPAYSDSSCDKRSLDEAKKKLEKDESTDEENIDNEEENDITDENNDVDTQNDDTKKEKDVIINKEDNEEIEDTSDEKEDNEEIEDTSDEKEDNKENKRNKLSDKIKMEFKLLKAINDIANNRNLDDVAKAVTNVGIEEMRKSGVNYCGQIQIPVNEVRADIKVATEGEDVVATDIFDILEPLRAKNVLVNAGASFLTNLVGDVQVPIMTGTNVFWEGETTTAQDGAGTFSNVKLQPKRLTAYIDISKQFLVQDSKSAEAKIRQDLINAINSKLESTILGSENGTVTQPKGLFYTATESPLKTIATFQDVCDLEASVEDANVINECVYVMSNKAKAKFRNMTKSSKTTQLVMEAGQIDGTPVFNTSNVGATNVAYGDFSQLAIGQWGAIDLTVDPYTQAADGKVRLVINAFFDAKVLRPGAIAVAKA